MVHESMPMLELKFSIDADALAVFDKLRDRITRDQFFRHALELGLCEIVENMTRLHRDYTTHLLSGTTHDYKQGRSKLFRVDDPDNGKEYPIKSVG